MKNKNILSLLFFLITISAYAQNRITINIDDFNALRVSGRIDVELIPSDSREMSITSREGQPEEVDVEFRNGELLLKVPPRLKNTDEISIRLPYKNLIRIESAAGAVINSARDLETDAIELKASTGGKIELGLQVNSIAAKITQVSDIILYGKAGSQNVSVMTGGNYLAYDMDCRETIIKVSSGSQGKVKASELIEATANSKGYIGYIGDPERAQIKTSLGGKIESFKSDPLDD